MKKYLFWMVIWIFPLFVAFAQTPSSLSHHNQPMHLLSDTKHEIRINGTTLKYTVTAGYLPVIGDSAKHKANMFFMAYKKEGVEDYSTRPLIFSFNGGPGSSSVWLHLGALGPKRVKMTKEGEALPPPYQLVTNKHTWLDMADLVFIDPVGTGYSHPAPGEEAEQFYGVEEDIRWVGEFIRMFVTRNRRWASPKFIIGESYGTTRAAGLSEYLQSTHGMYLNGIYLISSILNFQTARFAVGNDLPYILFLPTYTATAWYHHQLPESLQKDLQKTLKEVEQWAITDYQTALAKGSDLSNEEREEIVRQLARYTGLSESYIDHADMRINIRRFTKELLRDQHRSVGRLDSRFKGRESDWVSERPQYDPSYAAIQGPYTATLNDYIRTELRFKSDRPYEILTGKVQPWNWGQNNQGYVNVADDLRRAMSRNHHLKLFVACGYYDLATPYFATIYTINHLGLDPTLQDNITMAFYKSGHMMYIREKSLQKLKSDADAFMEKAIKNK